jgi:protein gp37
MSDKSKIEWTEATWNPVTGCTKVSAGCDHCYAETFAERWRGTPGHAYENGFDLTLRPERLDQPLRWTKPRRIFVNSMSDLFHDGIPDDYIADVFARMWWAPQHTFQVLTKRHGRMRSIMPRIEENLRRRESDLSLVDCPTPLVWPLPNVWLGVSVEDQKWADIRIPALIDTTAAVRWISAEPLLGPVDLNRTDKDALVDGGLDWVVAGGESGAGARPMHPDWARGLRDQCVAAYVPFLFKQWGQWVPPSQMSDDTFMRWDAANGTDFCDRDEPVRVSSKAAAGRRLDERTWDEYPRGGS